MYKYDLTGEWQFCELGKNKFYKASIPGCIHLDLMKNKLIPEPFYRMNEEKVQWVAEKAWLYKKKFHLTADFLNNSVVYLIFYGLDTFATITLNEHEIGKSENMFLVAKYEVKKYLKVGENILEVKFDSPIQRCNELEKQYIKLNGASYSNSSRLYARKAQYSFGWDWGPKLPTSGIWQPVELVAYKEIRIEDLYIKTTFVNIAKEYADVILQIQLETDNLVEKEYTITTTIVYNNEQICNKKEKYKYIIGENIYTTDLKLEKANLWWPNGFGKPHLYEVTVKIDSDGVLMDTLTRKIGIRKVEIEQEKDDEGKTFVIKINNIPIFCKGANWIPADSFVSRVTRETYERLLEAAKNANMNILRIWGGGIYENDIFYDFCDEKGIMLWHDFMFACGEYPEEEWFHENVKKEIQYQIKRLRNHPSIILWCGNNECDKYRLKKYSQDLRNNKYYGETLFYKILPHLCQKLDPTRPYWPTSPYGEETYYNSQSTGDRHSWDVWGVWHDGKAYEQDKGRFISEFGYQSLPAIKTINKFTASQDRKNPINRVMEFHDRGGPQALANVCKSIALSFPLPDNLAKFVTTSQINQGEVLRYGIEHWRRRKFKTSGTIIWQLNDCWPVISWSLIDYYFYHKAAYYIIKRAYAPVLLSIHQDGDEICIWIVNDRKDKVDAVLYIRHMTFSGKIISKEKIVLTISENNSQKVWSKKIYTKDPTQELLHTELISGNETIAESSFFFFKNKYLNLPKVKIKLTIKKKASTQFVAELTSDKIARFVNISSADTEISFSDNYFDLVPKRKKVVLIYSKKKTSISQLRKKITIETPITT